MLKTICLRPHLKFIFSRHNMSVFTKKINPITGKGEWIFHDESYDFHQEIARSAFADMLHDEERNQKYFKAIELAIQKTHAAGKKANVLDIGTGTGLLAMMAASCGADSVVACEGFMPMAYCAKKVISENNFSEKIKVVMKRSTDIVVGPSGDMECRANILVTEVFDTELIGEGALSTFIHAHEQLLEKDCLVIPSLAIIYIQVVESSLAQGWNRLRDWTENGLSLQTPQVQSKCPGAAAVHDLQLTQLPQNEFKTIVECTPVLRFDWTKRTRLDLESEVTLEVSASCDGVAQVVFVWWELCMDNEGIVKLSCAPWWEHPAGPHQPWRDHWMQALYYLPQELSVTRGQSLLLHASHDEYSLWFDLSSFTHPDCNHKTIFERPICECGLHIIASRTRFGCMNDASRRIKYMSAMRMVGVDDSVCLCLSDGSLLGPVAASMGARHVYCIETYPLAHKFLSDYVTNNNLEDRVTILGSIEDLSRIEGITKQVTVVFGEPSFYSSILPWHNICFWYLKDDVSHLLADDVKICPIEATLWAMPMEFDHLWKIRSPLHSVEGFSMLRFDELIDSSSSISDSRVEAHPLWEYTGRPITHPFQIMKLEFNKRLSEIDIEASGEVYSEWSGTCHGVALWVDWHLDGNGENTVSTGPVVAPKPGKQVRWDMHTRQGIYFMQVPRVITKLDSLLYKASFHPKCGEIDFEFHVSPKQ